MRQFELFDLTPRIDTSRPLMVDNFAGGGGASTGIELATGRSVNIAINHDELALYVHKCNHPTTRHLCEDVFDVDPLDVTYGQPVGLAWFSPDCKHFSKAKGSKPKNKKIRGLAWVAVKWAATVRPAVIFLENVEEFQDWGPLDENMQPVKTKKGNTYQNFLARLKNLGYAIETRTIRACDYGAPTIRKRFFMIARCDGQPIVWPEPTHADPKNNPHNRPVWKTAAECIDWARPCPSIFGRKRPLAPATLGRIAKGLKRFVLDASAPYIAPDHANAPRGENAELVAAFLTECANASNQRVFNIAEPLRTCCAEVKGGHHAIVTTHLVKLKGTCKDGQRTDEPLHTVAAEGLHYAEVRAFLVKYYGNDKDGCSLSDPLHTVTAVDRFGLVTIRGDRYQIKDIGFRMLEPSELYAAQGFPKSYIIAPPWNGKPLSKKAQVRMVGNSVCPPVASALVAANCPALCEIAA